MYIAADCHLPALLRQVTTKRDQSSLSASFTGASDGTWRARLCSLRRRKFSRNASAWRASRSVSLAVGFLGVFVISALYRETVIHTVDILFADGIVRRVISGRRSSVVERTIGNGEVESSILSGGTMTFPGFLRYLALSRDFRAPRMENGMKGK